jgi:hypothetical protein
VGEILVIVGCLTICAVVVAAGLPLTVTVADSVGAVDAGCTEAVIEVALAIFTPETETALPSGVVTVTVFTGQAEVALAVVVKLVPVIVTGL